MDSGGKSCFPAVMRKSSRDIPLAPFADFQKVVPKILSVGKRESDAHIASLHVENGKRREARKPK